MSISIIVKSLSYTHPNREVLFCNLNFSVSAGHKASLIGRNGSGKSTLLHIIARSLSSNEGEVICNSLPYYIPQHFGQYDEMTIAEALQTGLKLNALHAILGGNTSEKYFSDLADDWEIEERIKQAFLHWDIEHLQPCQKMKEISGGEKTKVFLSGIAIHNPAVVLMDEPSNHLDKRGRKKLHTYIKQSKSTLLIVSHDRELLNLLPSTLELTKNGIIAYGGNYDFYKTQKNGEIRALKDSLDEKEKALRLARKTAREAMERKQKADVRSAKSSAKKGIPRIVLNSLGNKAEDSSAKLKGTHAKKIESISNELSQIRQDLSQSKSLKLNFNNAKLHTGKALVTAEKINFGYSPESTLWAKPLSFEIKSGDRVVINGPNGSGKTTLLKLIFGLLSPTNGSIRHSGFSYVYIDQDYSIIDNRLTVLEQISEFNTGNLPEHDLKMLLNRFLFPCEVWNKTCDKLSGGEKMRLVFCCLMTSNNTPDLFILDEPTNNLDIDSLDIIASMLSNYEGTILVISHDNYFLNDIKINTSVNLQQQP